MTERHADDGGAKKPSGIRQFVLMASLLLVAAAVVGIFIYVQISRIGTSLDPQKVGAPAPTPWSMPIVPSPPSTAHVGDTPVVPKAASSDEPNGVVVTPAPSASTKPPAGAKQPPSQPRPVTKPAGKQTGAAYEHM